MAVKVFLVGSEDETEKEEEKSRSINFIRYNNRNIKSS